MSEDLFIAEILLVWALLATAQFPLRKERYRAIRAVLFVLKLILIPVVAVLFVAYEWWFAYNYGDILCALYVALIGDVAAGIVEFIIRRIRARNDVQRRRYDCRAGAPVGLAVCVVILAFGMVNAETVHMDTHEWQADGLSDNHTFAFAADMHAGTAQSMDVLREFVRQVNESDAEFLVLGGDVTDEHTSYDDMVLTYQILSAVSVPVYLVYGNHDRQPGSGFVRGRTYTDSQLQDAISAAGITLLVDEYVEVAPDLVLLGREDLTSAERKPWSELSNPYPGRTLIVADHQPYDREQLAAEVSALQLSGHTHAGQLWPLQTVYRLLDLPPFGEFEYPGTRLYVTPGEGLWSVPLRTEAHCAWELITLHP